MKNIKVLLIFLIIFILTGCTATGKISLNVDGSIDENIYIESSNSELKYGNKSVESSIDLYLKKYNLPLTIGKYNIKTNVGDENSTVIIDKNHKNICAFFNSSIFTQYIYDKFQCHEDNYYYVISNVGNVYQNSFEDYKDMPDDRKIEITLPIIAEEQNADEVNGTTYIWYYNKETPDDKEFYLKISKNLLKETKLKYENNIQKKESIKKISMIGGVIMLVILIGFILFMLYKKYQKNKLDY